MKSQPKTPREIIDHADLLVEKAQQEQERYLQESGWKQTCATPGSFWLWTKRITITRGLQRQEYAYDALCGRDLAVSLQRAVENE